MFDRVLYCGRGITLVSLELREECWWCSFKTFDVCDDEHVGQELADYLQEFQDHFHGKAILLVAMDAQGETWKPMGLKGYRHLTKIGMSGSELSSCHIAPGRGGASAGSAFELSCTGVSHRIWIEAMTNPDVAQNSSALCARDDLLMRNALCARDAACVTSVHEGWGVFRKN